MMPPREAAPQASRRARGLRPGGRAAAARGQKVDSRGAQLFAERCAGCHTLEAAGAEGSDPGERRRAPTSTSAARRRTRFSTRSATAASRARSCLRTSSSARTPRRWRSSSPSTRASRDGPPGLAGGARARRLRRARRASRRGTEEPATLDLKLIRRDPERRQGSARAPGGRRQRWTSCSSSTPGGGELLPADRGAPGRAESRLRGDRAAPSAPARTPPRRSRDARLADEIKRLEAGAGRGRRPHRGAAALAPEPARPDRPGRRQRGGRRGACATVGEPPAVRLRAAGPPRARHRARPDRHGERGAGLRLALRLPEGRAGAARAGAGAVRAAKAGRQGLHAGRAARAGARGAALLDRLPAHRPRPDLRDRRRRPVPGRAPPR